MSFFGYRDQPPTNKEKAEAELEKDRAKYDMIKKEYNLVGEIGHKPFHKITGKYQYDSRIFFDMYQKKLEKKIG